MKPINVLLVKSRSVVTKNAGVTPPLGILYIAAYIRHFLNARVNIIDALQEKDVERTVRRAINELKPDVVGISALTAEMFLAQKIAVSAKMINKDIPVIIGGPGPSADPEAVLNNKDFDVAVMGEGEETFMELLNLISEEGPSWKDPNNLRLIRGIVFKTPEGFVHTAVRPPIQDLDALPFPAWDLIDYRFFWKHQSMATAGIRPYFTMFTSRGCPFHCIYCHKFFGSRFRARSPENVIEEMTYLLGLGATDIEILDDIANFRHKRFDSILTGLLDKNLHPILSFPNAIRADIMREESIELLKQVGVGEVSVAIETASERLQRFINKKLSLEKAENTINALVKRRIFTRGFFMLGFPTETRDEILQTIRFAHRSRLHLALFFTPNPYKNTGLYGLYKEAGKLPANVNTIDYEYYGSPFNGSDVPDAEYRALYLWAYYGFYLNPKRMYRIARDRPYWSDIPLRVYYLFRNIASFRRLKESK